MATRESDRFLVGPGATVRLDAIDPSSADGAPGDKHETKAALADIDDRLFALHDRLWAERRRAVLLVLQAMDTGGKDGTIKRVLRGLNPQGVRVVSFKAPTELELAHDFLWRVHAQAPQHGELGVFNRSHYEDVLIVRVHELVPASVWQERYDQIKAFESTLAASGTTIVKVFLHISKDEQAERLQARLDDPEKRWKFDPDDLAEREHWDDYQRAYEDAITQTSTADAPWYIVPANRKWYRDWAVTHILLDAFERVDPHYPPATEQTEGIVIA